MNQEKNNQDKFFSLTLSQKIQVYTIRIFCKLSPNLASRLALYRFTKVRKRQSYNSKDLPGSIRCESLSHRKGYIATYSWGSGDKIIYIVHGWESHTGRMKSFIEPMLKSGFKVVVFDMPSHGHSTRQATHLKDFSSALDTVISHYGKPYGILAHSFGGTATVLLLHEKQQLMPEKLCLISPMKSLESHIDIFNKMAGLPQSIIKRLLVKLNNYYDLSASQTDITHLIKQVTSQGLLIHDEDDRLIPIENSKFISDAWIGSQFITTFKLGHQRILRDLDVIKKVTAYMSEA